jgi:DNA-binding transcriptional LysR family regulator
MASDIRTMDLNLLKALDALLDERNVTRAAERLALPQPAMNVMLTRLRESFGDQLFVRSQRGIVPTLRALELAGPLKQVLGDVQILLEPPAFDPALANLALTIAATDYALQAVVVPFLSVLRPRAPGIRVVVVPAQQQQLERGEVDLSLLTPESPPADLRSRRLLDERYVCLIRSDHPAAKSERISLDFFCALEHASVSYPGANFAAATDEALAKFGRERRVALSVNSFLVLPTILRESDMIAVVPRRLATHVEGLSVIDPPFDIPGFTTTAVWHQRTHHCPGQRWLRALLFEICESL